MHGLQEASSFGLTRTDTQRDEDQKRSQNEDRLLRLIRGGNHEESIYHKRKKARRDDQDIGVHSDHEAN